MENKILQREDLLYPEFSYQIVGILYDVYNKLGYGLNEKIYENAVAVGLKSAGINFEEQLYFPLEYKEEQVGRYYLDFLVEGKVVLELKRGDRFVKSHIDQVFQYLVAKKLQLGILAYFAPRNVHYKRIVNLHS